MNPDVLGTEPSPPDTARAHFDIDPQEHWKDVPTANPLGKFYDDDRLVESTTPGLVDRSIICSGTAHSPELFEV